MARSWEDRLAVIKQQRESQNDREKQAKAQEMLGGAQQGAFQFERAAEQEADEERRQEYLDEWQKFIEAAKNLAAGRRTGYDNLETALHEILASCVLMNKAIFLANDKESTEFLEAAINKATFGFSGTAKHLATEAGRSIREYIADRRVASPAADLDPTIRPIFDVTNDPVTGTKIHLTNFKLDDGSSIDAAHQEVLREGVVAWLGNHGMEIDTTADNKGVIETATREPVDVDALRALRDDPVEGISAHFRQYAKIAPPPPEDDGLRP